MGDNGGMDKTRQALALKAFAFSASDRFLLELPAQARRYTTDVSFFPRPVRADGAAPAVAPAVIGALAVERVGLLFKHINAQARIPMTRPAGWRCKGRRGAWQWLWRLGNRHVRQRLASWLRRRLRHRGWRGRGGLIRRLMNRTGAQA